MTACKGKTHHACGYHQWYLAAETFFGKHEALYPIISNLRENLNLVGCSMNLDKCQIWGPPTGTQKATTLPCLKQFDHIPWKKGKGITLLGTPLDPPDVLWGEFLTSAALRVKETISKVYSIEDPQL